MRQLSQRASLLVVIACGIKPLTPGEVDAEGQTERGFQRKQGWLPKDRRSRFSKETGWTPKAEGLFLHRITILHPLARGQKGECYIWLRNCNANLVDFWYPL